MPSLPPPTTTTTTSSSSSTLISTFSSCPFFNKTSPISIIRKHNHLFKVSCKATNNNHDQNSSNLSTTRINSSKIEETCLEKVDRRNVVLGLGGLCSAASLGGTSSRLALAAPVLTPDFTKCEDSTKDRSTEKINCCPPTSAEIIDFKPLPPPKVKRVRPAAHLVDNNYIDKFSRAIKLMKELPEDDPRNFTQQANVHCAYCNGGYDQVGQSGVELQVHNSWLFFPFHRWQLYFYEKILGKLIDDPSFALPFWNWDDPVGMPMPLMYTDPNSPLYDSKRNPDHQPPVLPNLQTGATIEKDLVYQNLFTMHREMLINGKDFEGFFGKTYRAGDTANPGAGSIEGVPHTSIHKFSGDPRQPLGEDMGAFYSAGRDPIFYALHANVDRMWTINGNLTKQKKKKDFVFDPDWLNATFLFYDENKKLVRVKVKDCLTNTELGYDYQDVGPLPWLEARPMPKFTKNVRKARKLTRGITKPSVTVLSPDDFPIKLDKIVRVTVPRPKKSRSTKEKEEKEEKLVIVGIEVDSGVFVQFDVYVNDEDEGEIGPENTEFAGSFLNLPHAMKKMDKLKTNLNLSISDLLDDLGVDDDDSVVVTLVPKFKSGVNVTIGGIKIEC